MDQNISVPDWTSETYHPAQKTNKFVIMAQTFYVEKYAQNPIRNTSKTRVYVNKVTSCYQTLHNIQKTAPDSPRNMSTG